MSKLHQDNIYFEIDHEDSYSECNNSTQDTCDKTVLSASSKNEQLDNTFISNDENEITEDHVVEQIILDDDAYIVDKTVKYTSYTLKQLILICEYYGIHKEVKYNKLKKDGIIEQIIWYEMQMENVDIVNKRIKLWRYMSEIKNDPVLGKLLPHWTVKDVEYE